MNEEYEHSRSLEIAVEQVIEAAHDITHDIQARISRQRLRYMVEEQLHTVPLWIIRAVIYSSRSYASKRISFPQALARVTRAALLPKEDRYNAYK